MNFSNSAVVFSDVNRIFLHFSYLFYIRSHLYPVVVNLCGAVSNSIFFFLENKKFMWNKGDCDLRRESICGAFVTCLFLFNHYCLQNKRRRKNRKKIFPFFKNKNALCRKTFAANLVNVCEIGVNRSDQKKFFPSLESIPSSNSI